VGGCAFGGGAEYGIGFPLAMFIRLKAELTKISATSAKAVTFICPLSITHLPLNPNKRLPIKLPLLS